MAGPLTSLGQEGGGKGWSRGESTGLYCGGHCRTRVAHGIKTLPGGGCGARVLENEKQATWSGCRAGGAAGDVRALGRLAMECLWGRAWGWPGRARCSGSAWLARTHPVPGLEWGLRPVLPCSLAGAAGLGQLRTSGELGALPGVQRLPGGGHRGAGRGTGQKERGAPSALCPPCRPGPGPAPTPEAPCGAGDRPGAHRPRKPQVAEP